MDQNGENMECVFGCFSMQMTFDGIAVDQSGNIFTIFGVWERSGRVHPILK
jgi:hypothetical protein